MSKDGKQYSSILVSHFQRNVNRNKNDEELWNMRRSAYTQVKNMGSLLVRGLDSHSDIEHIRSLLIGQSAIDSKKATWAAFVGRVIQAINPSRILEIGTCVGVSAAYISRYNPQVIIDSIELDEGLVEAAQMNFEE